jgi:VRR-NUC domain
VTESQLVTACLKWLKLHRVVHFRVNNIAIAGRSFRGTKGVADIIAICPGGQGRLLAIECKTKDGKLRPEQQNWLCDVTQAGGMAIVVRDIADLEKLWKEMGW